MVGILRLLGDGLRETRVDVGRWCVTAAAAAVPGIDVVTRIATGRLLDYLSATLGPASNIAAAKQSRVEVEGQ